jgi:hypothetical protein
MDIAEKMRKFSRKRSFHDLKTVNIFSKFAKTIFCAATRGCLVWLLFSTSKKEAAPCLVSDLNADDRVSIENSLHASEQLPHAESLFSRPKRSRSCDPAKVLFSFKLFSLFKISPQNYLVSESDSAFQWANPSRLHLIGWSFLVFFFSYRLL